MNRFSKVAMIMAASLALVVVGTMSPAGAQYDSGDGSLTASTSSPAAGQEITVSGDGYKANSEVIITIESTPVEIGRTTADSSGKFSTKVKIPAGMSGSHTIKATGVSPQGGAWVLTRAVTVSTASGTGGSGTGENTVGNAGNQAGDGSEKLAWTGSNALPIALTGLAAVVIGVGLVVRGRRRADAV